MENWVNVLEFNKKTENMMQWFFKLLDEEKIPHNEEIKEYWIGNKQTKYEQNVLVYVPKEYKEMVESYLKEYNNLHNIVYEEAEELRNISIDEDNESEEFQLTNISQKVLKYIFVGMILIVTIGIIISSI